VLLLPELCSLGTSPKHASTWCGAAKRPTSSSAATKPSAVTGPIIGIVCSSRAGARSRASAVRRRSALAIAMFIGARRATRGVSSRRVASDSGIAANFAAARDRPARGGGLRGARRP
jgi:hypothetical protein